MKLKPEELEAAIDEARGHLGACLIQQIDADDEIILTHVRDAFVALGGKVQPHWFCARSSR